MSPVSETEVSKEVVQHWRDQLHWRYATKAYQPSEKITDEQWHVILESVRFAPSSYGLQPYKVVLVDDSKLRQELRAAAWGQSQVTDANHLVVFAAKQKVTEQDIDDFIKLTAETRGMPLDALKPYRDVMVGDLVKGPRAQHIADWSARQCYIALGFLLAAAAVQKVDASPMEGFDPDAFTKILKLDEIGHKAVVIAAVGHRAPNDWLAPLKKVRWPENHLFIRK